MIKASSQTLRTFCHISEYAEAGYEQLHRLLAVSSPLVLWSPSTLLLEWSGCRISPADFLDYVNDGHIRIIGREEWVLSKEKRNSHGWPKAQWVDSIDNTLRIMALGDQYAPLADRRVVIAEPEKGRSWAEAQLHADNELARKINDMLKDPRAVDDIPAGVRQTAARHPNSARGLAFQVLRDAFNHVEAVKEAASQAPFMLQPRENRFIEVMTDIAEGSLGQRTVTPVQQGRLSDSDMASFTGEVLELLRRLDSAGQTPLRKFVGSSGHHTLAEWIAEVLGDLTSEGASNVQGSLFRRFRKRFDKGELKDDWKDLLTGASPYMGYTDIGLSVADTVQQNELTVLGALSLLVGLLGTAGLPVAQKLGFVPVNYTGEQWPFLYTFGAPASGKRRAALERVLDTLIP